MREYKDVTRRRGGHFSSFDNVKSKVDCAVGFPTHFKKDERKREREQLWLSELESE